MRRIAVSAVLLAAIFGGAIVAEDKTPTIETIMKKNNGKNGLHKKIGEGLKAATPAWDDLAKTMKDYEKNCASLGKNDCPMGDKADWEKLTKAYADNAKKLQEAIDKKDKDAAKKAHQAIQKSCKACHETHK